LGDGHICTFISRGGLYAMDRKLTHQTPEYSEWSNLDNQCRCRRRIYMNTILAELCFLSYSYITLAMQRLTSVSKFLINILSCVSSTNTNFAYRPVKSAIRSFIKQYMKVQSINWQRLYRFHLQNCHNIPSLILSEKMLAS
jgi:hypothetical protein